MFCLFQIVRSHFQLFDQLIHNRRCCFVSYSILSQSARFFRALTSLEISSLLFHRGTPTNCDDRAAPQVVDPQAQRAASRSSPPVPAAACWCPRRPFNKDLNLFWFCFEAWSMAIQRISWKYYYIYTILYYTMVEVSFSAVYSLCSTF